MIIALINFIAHFFEKEETKYLNVFKKLLSKFTFKKVIGGAYILKGIF